jgi:hypothetical protein
MTHAESQDLLLELAYGELDAQRAAEMEAHLAGCAECRAEKAALDEARRVAAPLREAEEPPAGFDGRILEAARAEAHHQHDGNVGQVIETAANVHPLGLDAARIDAHGPVKARPPERKRPKWMVRAALGGSVAAAAALALVVSTTLDARRASERASQARSDDYRIRVKPAGPDAVDAALRDAEEKREQDRLGRAKEDQPAGQAPARLEKKNETRAEVPSAPPAAAGKKQEEVAVEFGPPAAAEKYKQAPAPQRDPGAERGARKDGAAGSALKARAAQPLDAASADSSAGAAPSSAGSVAAASPPSPVAEQPKALAKAPPAAGEMEAYAQQARHAGNYTLAASLYRNAADARRRDGDAPSAAWNLAHAVECLSAMALFDEARQVREELTRLYPSEAAPLSAARRALREVDVPSQSAPASKQK